MAIIRRLFSAFSGGGRRRTAGRSMSGGLMGAIKGFMRGSSRGTHGTTRGRL